MKQKIQDFMDGREIKYINKEHEEVKESFKNDRSSLELSQSRNFNFGVGTFGANLGPTESARSNDRRKKQVIKKCTNIRDTFKEAIDNIADKLFALIRSRIQDQ